MELLNRETISMLLTREADWAWSHGAAEHYLGMGLLYYSIVYINRAQTVVCLGSGGGFVPRLMRQAQRDLGLAEIARTILVDANKPEVNWGAPAWLSPDSFFRQAFSDVELFISTTSEAAKNYFSPQAIVIDYLHIDADHSFAGCLEDFRLYRPFLRKGAIVTLHDSNLDVAGVGAVVEYLRTREDCEVLDLPDSGCGTALVRITGDHPPRFGGEEKAAIGLVIKEAAMVLEPPASGWKDLECEILAARSAIAATFLNHCRTVVEIGGGELSIDRFLNGDQLSVIFVDQFGREIKHILQKLGPEPKPGKVQRIRARFQDLEWTILQPHQYGLVMPSFELEMMTDAHYQTLFHLIDNSQVTIIEFSSSGETARRQFELVRQRTSMRERFVFRLDLKGSDTGTSERDGAHGFRREIHVLEPSIS